jgi:diguanylate cyclase
MQPAVASPEKPVEIAMSVVAAMRQLGVIGLPRNYEIFYEALTGSNPELSLEVVSLSNRPSQDDLDRIGRKFFAHHHGHNIVSAARETLAKEFEDLAQILRSERVHLEKYGEVLSRTSQGLNGSGVMGQELLKKVVSVMTSATSTTIEHGRQVASTLKEKSAELESVKSALEEYKVLADTDALTQICNRRAFDRRIAEVYGSSRGVMFSSLILADIDNFKDINDRYGHPVGDKIIQVVADIFRSSAHEGMFVARTGGEEFAIIVDGAPEQGVVEFAETLRTLVAQTPFTAGNGVTYGPVTISLGLCMASQGDSADDLYGKADRALYRSKLTGRNRVTTFTTVQDKPLKSWLLYKKD